MRVGVTGGPIRPSLFAVALVGIPLLFVTFVGYYAGLVAGALFTLGILVARLLAGFYAGLLLRKWSKSPQAGPLPFGWVAGGILVLHVIGSIPVLGWIVTFGLSLVALGAIWGLTVQSLKVGEGS